ncbi:hypothetical protein HNP46_000366 [Pseudomonas nitritireducens]|uniref:Uncharacterized protein n=1 Tax=Pseudomonas nitroreducens TaxID=46680 RepID=A0A7W7KFK1_PSENT|nr:hypothetical protein [Pseudomonas nitritireducens]MBB4861555.1 hypothetical protein [Pseudomonas nitritireducens]
MSWLLPVFLLGISVGALLSYGVFHLMQRSHQKERQRAEELLSQHGLSIKPYTATPTPGRSRELCDAINLLVQPGGVVAVKPVLERETDAYLDLLELHDAFKTIWAVSRLTPEQVKHLVNTARKVVGLTRFHN